MRKACLLLVVGTALTGCFGPQGEPEPARPAGDAGRLEDEFRVAHQTALQLTRQLDELRATGGPGRPLDQQFPESVALSRALTAAQRTAGRLGCQVGLADPAGSVGGDGLFDCLLFSTESLPRLRTAFDLAVRHHPHDPRLGEYLYAVMRDGPPRDADRWLTPAVDRVLATSAHPAVRAAAQAGKGRLLLQSRDPAEVAAGERLLAEVVRHHPDEVVGQTRVAAWATHLLAERQQPPSGGVVPSVRLAP